MWQSQAYFNISKKNTGEKDANSLFEDRKTETSYEQYKVEATSAAKMIFTTPPQLFAKCCKIQAISFQL